MSENKGALHPEQKKWKAPKGPKPVHHKNRNTIGLGRSIANQRLKENSIEYLPDGEMRFTTDKKQAGWVKLRSVTQENSLDEFLNTAELADHDFTAEKGQQVKIIKVGNTSLVNQTGLLSEEETIALREKHQSFENRLTIPRRPKWSKEQLKLQIERQENLAFLEWRRQLAALTETNDLLLTPFERNIEVWRQLWRVVERCDLVVQIVDARSPLDFRSVDLEKYVSGLSKPDEGKEKRNLLLVNKADLLTRNQRIEWANYFKEKHISYVFFSAANANALLEKELEEEQNLARDPTYVSNLAQDAQEEEQEDIRILKIEELEHLFMATAPLIQPSEDQPDRKLQIGLVGYPNVGKSSTINALVGSKKVSVSATPGKTKHFQTIFLSPEVVLCDCPGLVFPNFAYSNGELVCNGVLPIDQLREHIPPSSLVCQRIPKFYLEAVYGIHIPIQSKNDGGNGIYPTARELLNAYARARGYMTQGFGSADESRASRYILKDYVNGKLLYINPPPKKLADGSYGIPSLEESREFNKDVYTLQSLPETRQQQLLSALAAKNIKADDFDLSRDLSKLNFSMHLSEDPNQKTPGAPSTGPTTRFYGGRQAALESAADDLDKEFFKMNDVQAKMNSAFHKNQLGGKGDKKHNKKNKKADKKVRVVGY
ncbi:P-loop containing nucleoside triphosphate hydrolase protein [Metschnikowia bicuspidata var. bicuspidata NRRL YB-4993]|uniref:p-loop containing nucleoside triphosphate hydrolase protein n=1 Tax=Metschnikowia bicuspidata var. bicuspidata NRRL YB-4993 TaxID=869754 RepID=A0A1A0H209_9ASCO|nr:P-loop containing nucleoside triphosphate hydrolase protein [Metschnikowia bicuspidata var. bicuspidata NRRL YB-4993]OBA17993.1 P-loop containing nucleoside triphosphate hydrolase protein [Metschnikowia bicuspidata var. bicuspidata NRRL YB-4993]